MGKSVETPVVPPAPLNPWRAVWLRPRATIQAILESSAPEETDRLAVVMGISLLLLQFDTYPISWRTFAVTIALSLLLGPVAGLIVVRLGGALYQWAGKLWGGNGTLREVRAALAWSSLPQIAALPLQLLLLLALVGLESATPNPIVAVGIVVLNSLIRILLGWSLVARVVMLAEAHGFSLVRAVATFLTPFLWVIVIGILCSSPQLFEAWF